MAKEITWTGVLQTVMNMPGVTVDRDSFLKNSFSLYSDEETINKIIKGRPFQYLNDMVIDKIADNAISGHTTKVTAISAIAGIPGGLGMVVAVPADVAQYYWHVLVLAQKLAYIYGYPDLRDEFGKLSKESIAVITLFVGVMSGVASANKAIQEVVEQLMKEAINKISQQVLEKSAIYPIVANVAKSLGIAITKKAFSRTISKIIPLIGAVISGGLTLAGFYPSAKALQKRLRIDMAQFKEAQRSKPETDEFQEAEQVD